MPGERIVYSGDKAFVEVARGGKGQKLQEQIKRRLGDKFTEEFDACATSGEFRRVAEKYKDELRKDEYRELINYADYMGMLFGFQDEDITEEG